MELLSLMEYVDKYGSQVESFSRRCKGKMGITRQSVLNRINKNIPLPFVDEIRKSGNSYVLVIHSKKKGGKNG